MGSIIFIVLLSMLTAWSVEILKSSFICMTGVLFKIIFLTCSVAADIQAMLDETQLKFEKERYFSCDQTCIL
jgi:hypothetical protein